MATAFGKILLITGNAEFLADRTRARAVKAVTGEHPECQVAEASASGLQPGELAGLTSPSLFSDVSALVLTELQDLPDVALNDSAPWKPCFSRGWICNRYGFPAFVSDALSRVRLSK